MKNEKVRNIITPEKKKVNRAFQTKPKIPKKSGEVRNNPACIPLAESRIRYRKRIRLPMPGQPTSPLPSK
jgi:hypothetical protein